MRKKSLFILFGVIFFFALGVFSFLVSRQQSAKQIQEQTTEGTAPRVLPISVISEIAETEKYETPNARFEYSMAIPSFPSTLPSYSVQFDPNPQGKTAKLAAKWGFSTLSKQIVSYVYDYRSDSRLFSLNTNTGSISYTAEISEDNKLPQPTVKEAEWIQDARDAGFSMDIFTIIPQPPTTFTGDGAQQKVALKNTEYVYYIKNTQYPVFFRAFHTVPANSTVVPSGDTTSLSFIIPPVSLVQKDTREILSAQGILTALNQQKGYLSYINEGNEIEYGDVLVPTFLQVRITSVSLAYFLAEDNTLVPLFVINGDGVGEAPQKVRYFLRASS